MQLGPAVPPPAVRKGLPFRRRPKKKNDVISLSDAFVSEIANENGLRSMQETALTRGHLRNCQQVGQLTSLTACGESRGKGPARLHITRPTRLTHFFRWAPG